MKQVRVFISGRVQGVFFRKYTEEKAQSLRLNGWVRNRLDGRVEALFQGKPDLVDDMVAWCQTGSPQSKVDNVEAVQEAFEESVENFSIEKTI